MTPELRESYRAAEAIARSRSNFYYSFIVLPAEKRLAFCAVYAFMRHCDDISDEEGANGDKRERLRRWRRQLDAACPGDASASPILPAFRDTLRNFSIPAQYFHWIIDGEEMDLEISRYDTFEELYRYCFRVASAVGLVCLRIFGSSGERAEKLAEHCGIAFQLTNILRDVKEDAQRGRIYLPLEDLRRFRYAPEDLAAGVLDDRFRALMRHETERAREFYRHARELIPLVDVSSRPALWAMIEIYERILERIAARGFDVFGERVRLSPREKTAVALKAIAMRAANRVGLALPRA
ncbi:MAG: presqualene diphosphate synthase HpnD [Acidobacteria bacterium]|nr:presqualene diphosphate synthase HpnD [Acidobacteriota bacterium]